MITGKVRCAIYTRKSSEEGLDQEFNSLDAQREACASYIVSQKHEGWVCLPDRYDDGGFSGGTIERPALRRLLTDIAAGMVDLVVVYKIDRLTRSLMDFAKLVELFEKHGVNFVCVTQPINTATSMGRLMLNVLLSFAQFERELTSERLRDKVAASKKRGLWMGGFPVLGYDVRERKLVVNPAEAKIVRRIFEQFVKLGSGHQVAAELRAEGITGKAWVSRRGKAWNPAPMCKSVVYRVLSNRLYVGEISHKGQAYKGEHEPIIGRSLWDRAQTALRANAPLKRTRTKVDAPALLKGLIFGPNDRPMSPSHTRKAGKLYRYYVETPPATPVGTAPLRIPAGLVETIVLDQIRGLVRTPEIVARTWTAARRLGSDLSEREATQALGRLDEVWAELFPAEQARIIRLLVERVEIRNDGVAVQLRTGGLGSVIDDLRLARPATPSAPATTRRAA